MPPNSWSCLAHGPASPAWQTVQALGAVPPCRIPLEVSERRRLAKAGDLTESTATVLVADPTHVVRRLVAGNVNTPIAALRLLARDSAPGVRWGVADNRRTPADSLRLLAADSVVAVRMRVAFHLETPVETLRRLASDPTVNVRWSVAANPALRTDALHSQLARDADAGVRVQVAQHALAPEDALRLLIDDPNPTVRKRARQALGQLAGGMAPARDGTMRL